MLPFFHFFFNSSEFISFNDLACSVMPLICASYVSLSFPMLLSNLFSCCRYFSATSVSATPVFGFMFAFLSFNNGNTLSHLYSLAGSSNPEMKK